ncbi:MAG: glycosyltransferase [bacterium]
MLTNYEHIIPKEELNELEIIANQLKNIKVLQVNSTNKGGGVAEILNSLVFLMNSLGIKTDWKIIKGNNDFFKFTKKLHNLLHLNTNEDIESNEINIYLKTTYENLSEINTEDYDVVFIHDPQPLALVVKKQKHQKWIWRCHIDTSTPHPKAWDFIELFINSYDVAIFHMPDFIYKKIKIPTYIIPPSIDPLHPKNIPLDNEFILKVLERFSVDPEKPILLQVSRFDKLKDPIGVYNAYKLIRKKYDCQLVLLGSFASDDPEGEEVYKEVINQTIDDKNVFVLNLPPDSHKEVNAFQRAATIVFQKSIKEGFGLVVSEAMYKYKPVIGGNTGGIKRQIIDGFNGYLVSTYQGAAFRARQLLADKILRQTMGQNAHNIVKYKFLITRHLKDYLTLIYELIYGN